MHNQSLLTAKTICVYCGSSSNVDEKYFSMAREMGKILAQRGYEVVYGGGQTGLMGALANAALTENGRVIGIIPGHIDQREIRHEGLSELHVVDSMHKRKQMMADRSDAFIILPGGMGTMEEFFEILTWRQLGLHDKAILIFNFESYWDQLMALVRYMSAENFAKVDDLALFYECRSIPEVMAKLSDLTIACKDFQKNSV